MEDKKNLKGVLEELVDSMDLGDDAMVSIRDFAAQVIFPAVAAKIVLNNLHDVYEELNDQNADLLGFRMDEVDFLKALHALIPARITEIENEKESFENTPYIDTGDVS